ncbi:hypothetical protein KEM60_01522 [Austwickia sp. TVS 96-490-7B]|uniref:hypothetical protein n=1 Tax=Austwickia sp. TVS 96-490-7B TaxID=2830843 RepID=UPI001C5975DB|nr:hypothetical protein [Austwickia sp. TVS 96-490-7B]MBW3085325.1 hypothetical protein [Austwickia sp. TVS 96-490-7B]
METAISIILAYIVLLFIIRAKYIHIKGANSLKAARVGIILAVITFIVSEMMIFSLVVPASLPAAFVVQISAIAQISSTFIFNIAPRKDNIGEVKAYTMAALMVTMLIMFSSNMGLLMLVSVQNIGASLSLLVILIISMGLAFFLWSSMQLRLKEISY